MKKALLFLGLSLYVSLGYAQMYFIWEWHPSGIPL